ncbi:uncharacterized protein FA14DRAFT_176028 [Meira miltonrushii]|uniref:Uncharacterized protein n=1 Tax=Meira miltonrushii TaxID=1280837 RepID=A0A316VKX6_9BASI|nr:uncharacterized protein FA14DRAFT_176028 [Meira miltonrushii]PWN36721.1 hypothetical protein FA14DRAFT_176028 [Meira miltonrushii]
MNNEDVANFPDSIIEAMMNWSFNNTQKAQAGGVTPIYKAPVGKYDANEFYNYGGYGQDYDSSNPNLDVQFYVPDQIDQQNGALPLQACYTSNTYTVSDFNQDTKDCQVANNTLSGSTADPGTQVAVQVSQGYSLAVTADTSITQSYTAGITVTLTYGFDAEIEQDTVAAAVSFSYSYSSTTDHSVTQQTNTQTTETVTINPPAGNQCDIVLSAYSCPGSVTLSFPVYFTGQITAHYFNGNPVPGAASEYYFYPDFQSDIIQPYDSIYHTLNASDIVQPFTFTFATNGEYTEQCECVDPSICGSGASTATSTSTSSAPSPTYTPSLSCPTNLPVVNACNTNLPSYLSDLQYDSSQFTAHNVTINQQPAQGQELSFGLHPITFTTSTNGQTSATCSSALQIVPPWTAEFVPNTYTLTYPNDGSDINGEEYIIGYYGQCGANQYGQCRLESVTSEFASNFAYKQTSPDGAAFTILNLSNGGQEWPAKDMLSFVISCFDAYGNNGQVMVYQQATRAPGTLVTQTVDANTDTITQQSTTSFLYTSIETFNKFTTTPATTVDLLTATLYTATSISSTETIIEYGATPVTSTIFVPSTTELTVTKTSTATQTGASISSDVVTALTTYPPVTVTSFSTKPSSTITVGSTITDLIVVTETASPTPCKRSDALKRRMERRSAPTPTITTTYTDKSLTETVTDTTDTKVIYTDGTLISTDYTQIETVFGSKTVTIYEPYVTTTVEGVLTTNSIKIVDALSTSVTATQTLTSTDIVNFDQTITVPSITTVTQTHGSTPTVTTTVDVTSGVTTVTDPNIPASAPPVVKFSTTTIYPACTTTTSSSSSSSTSSSSSSSSSSASSSTSSSSSSSSPTPSNGLLSNGLSCHSSTQCQSGNCYHRKCAAKMQLGQTGCYKSQDCISGNCYKSTCVPLNGQGVTGNPCRTSGQCQNGLFCDHESCSAKLGWGGSCYKSEGCLSNKCNWGKCA